VNVRIAVDGPLLPNGFPHLGAMTDANGNYVINGLTAGANWTVRPDDPHFDFTPPFVVFSNLSGNRQANFTATRAVAPIVGRVVDGSTGVAGVTMTATRQ
jgi:hypothetical protein